MNRSLSVVVADDEPDMQDYFRIVLPRLGHRVVGVAGNGRELVELRRTYCPDLVITDVRMPELDGIDAAMQVCLERPTPVILVSAFHDAGTIQRAESGHIMSYLVKPIRQADLEPAIALAMRRFEELQEIRELSLTDDLTGLYNRRGFATLASQQIRLARRMKRKLWLAMVDVDALKQINDSFGHGEGDRALKDTADVLRNTFRASDIVARLGGDEFGVLAMEDAQDGGPAIAQRLAERLQEFHAQYPDRPYNLSLSSGVVPFDVDGSLALDGTLACADSLLYQHKRSKRKV
jgi:diguanylate cyclase (GGDEF)-like protein